MIWVIRAPTLTLTYLYPLSLSLPPSLAAVSMCLRVSFCMSLCVSLRVSVCVCSCLSVSQVSGAHSLSTTVEYACMCALHLYRHHTYICMHAGMHGVCMYVRVGM